MSGTESPPISESDLAVLSNAARIDFADGRAAVVAPALNGVLELLEVLDAVDLGETPPTNSFDARWRTGDVGSD